MPTIECTQKEFRGAVKEFLDLLPTFEDCDQVENAFKAVSLHYFGVTEDRSDLAVDEDVIVLQLAAAKSLDRQAQLLTTDN